MLNFKHKFLFSLLFFGAMFLTSCMKEEYDFNKFSKQASISPSFKLPVAFGTLTLSNAVKPREDTLIFNDDGTIKLIFRKDSLFSLDVQDVVTIPDPAPQSNTRQVGPLLMPDLQYPGGLTLDEVSQNLAPAIRSYLVANSGSSTTFPAIPAQSAGTYNLPVFSNFTQVVVSTGSISITFTNNFPVQVSFNLGLKNQSDNSPVGGDFVFSNVPAGGNQTQTVDISGVSVSNQLAFDLKNFSSPGSGGNNVSINLNDSLKLFIASQNVRVLSGTTVLPDQFIYADTDQVDVDPDPGIEITYVEIATGQVDYTVSSGFGEGVVLRVVLPTASLNGDTLRYNIPLAGNGTSTSSLSLNNVHLDLTSDPAQPFNRFPFKTTILVTSSGNQVTFDLTDQFIVDYQVKNIHFGYVEGFFGQQTYTIDKDTLDLNMDDFFNRITGTITFTDPMIGFPYFSTLGVNANLDLQATGMASDGTTQDLNASVQPVSGMTNRNDPPKEGTVLFSRDNSDIVDLISIRPNQIVYSGDVIINPGGNTGARDNFIFGDSHITAGLEVELPWRVKIQNLAMRDTVDSPFYTTDTSEFSLSDLDYFNFIFDADNGFPLGASFVILPYESSTSTVTDTIRVPNLISPAPVDSNGKVTGPEHSRVRIDLSDRNLVNLETSNQLIFRVTFNSTPGAPEVVFYTDYTFDFRLAAETQGTLDFDLGN